MENNEKVIQELFNRIGQLSLQQKVFQDEIQKLYQDIHRLKTNAPQPEKIREAIPLEPTKTESKVDTLTASKTESTFKKMPSKAMNNGKAPWEEFIGSNLLNKVGIAVLVLGIGFGAKYSIDHQFLNPLTRIILGYLAGIGLIGIAFRLKKKHTAFSAVLLSGGMAVLYFMTYAAYTFYGLIPQTMAFVMMVLFTVFTVFAAVQYNLEVIGIIGLVGAYAVPVLLSDGSGRVVILFSYISIINIGILFLAFKKYWRRLYYLAFMLTWLTFCSWYAFSFDPGKHVPASLIFSTIFFLIFYTTFLAYKLLRKEVLDRWDVVFMLLNSFIYFAYGYLTVESVGNGGQYLGLFTVFTALLHFMVCLIIYKQQNQFSDIFYFAAGMVLIFLTIAVPVQLEGNWVTLVWAGEAALLFWIGRSKSFPTCEKLSCPLIVLAFISLLHDWSNDYPGFYYYASDQDATFRIFLNVQFLTSALVAISFLFIFWVSKQKDPVSPTRADSTMHKFLTIGLPLLTLTVLYIGFYKEIEAFWNYRYGASRLVVHGADTGTYDQYDTDLLHFKGLWLLIFSALFGTALSLIQWKVKNYLLAVACLVINSLVIFSFITAGLLDISALRSSFLDQHLAEYYDRDYGHLLIRYFSILIMLPLLWFNAKFVRAEFFNDTLRHGESLFFHFIALALLSSELIHWLDIARVENSFKLSLSILWGAYALFLIVVGLSRDQRHIRLGAIVLFAATLLKLFAYDMADMSTILKTVVMIILGALLLTASFIYNKYKRSAGNETP